MTAADLDTVRRCAEMLAPVAEAATKPGVATFGQMMDLEMSVLNLRRILADEILRRQADPKYRASVE